MPADDLLLLVDGKEVARVSSAQVENSPRREGQDRYLSLGRSGDVAIEDPRLRRAHARIGYSPLGWRIWPLEDDVTRNDEPLPEATWSTLMPGDRLSLGGVALSVGPMERPEGAAPIASPGRQSAPGRSDEPRPAATTTLSNAGLERWLRDMDQKVATASDAELRSYTLMIRRYAEQRLDPVFAEREVVLSILDAETAEWVRLRELQYALDFNRPLTLFAGTQAEIRCGATPEQVAAAARSNAATAHFIMAAWRQGHLVAWLRQRDRSRASRCAALAQAVGHSAHIDQIIAILEH